MARIYGLNGLIRGRQGNNVFSIQNGTQVLKQYNPAVSNPRTTAQQIQRIKFALAGKLSGCTPNDALVGLVGSSKRGRRADFVSRIARNATSSIVGNGYQASIAFSQIVFSKGAVAKYSAATAVSGSFQDARTITASMPAMSAQANAPAGYNELVIVGLFDGSAYPLDQVQVQLRSRTAAASFTFQERSIPNCVLAAWIVPFIASSRTAGMISGNLGTTTDDLGVNVTSVDLLLANGAEFGDSLFNNRVLLQAPTTMVSPVDDMRGVVEEALEETAVAEGKRKK